MKFNVFLAGAALAVACVSSAQAGSVLDANFSATPHSFYTNSQLYRAQTFTVEHTGQLTSFDVRMSGDGSSLFEIWNVSAGEPVAIPGAALASGVVKFSGEGFFGADISAFDLDVTAGEVLALVQIGGHSTGYGSWEGAASQYGWPSSYSGGAVYTTYVYDPSGAWHPTGDSLQFETFVDVASTVPEPATWAMLILGVGMTGFAARRRGQGGVATA